MSFINLAKERFSARHYLPKKVEEVKLNYILEAARVAPTAANKQPVKIFIIQHGKLREDLNQVYKRDWIKEAPVLLVICCNHREAWKHPTTLNDAGYIDASIVTDHITLAATDIGLSTCWICNFDIEKCSEILNLDTNLEPVAMLTLGYTDQKPDINRHNINRKPNKELFVFKN